MTKLDNSVKARFFAKVRMSDDCWLWCGARRTTGYGVFSLGGVCYAAHRIVFAIEHPEYEGEMLSKRSAEGFRRDYVLHSCDNPSCVNPAHLRLGTATDNADDMMSRHRNARSKGPTARKGEKRKTWEESGLSPKRLR